MNKCVWFTGLSASGKSTLSLALKKSWKSKGRKVYLLDGDELRKGLCKDLGFSEEDRLENIRRAAELARLFLEEGYWVVVAMITPLDSMRALARNILNEELITIYLSTPLSICEARDPKGLYQKARTGEIKYFTGLDAPFEVPSKAEITLDTSQVSVEACLDFIESYVEKHK